MIRHLPPSLRNHQNAAFTKRKWADTSPRECDRVVLQTIIHASGPARCERRTYVLPKMNPNLVKLLSFVLLLMLLAACGPKEEVVPSKGILYTVAGGDTTVYLFGSIHIGHSSMYPLCERVQQALEEADVIALEIDISAMLEEEIAQEVMAYAMYTDGALMTDVISQDLFDQLAEIVADIGLPRYLLNHFRPWYAALLLNELVLQNTRYSPALGVESYLLDNYGHKETISLETFSDQLAPYALLSDESQEVYLRRMLEDMDEAEQDLDEMVEYWRDGNVEAFSELRSHIFSEAETASLKRFHQATLDERDRAMAKTIAGILASGDERTYFITVGTLHLVGANSIVAQLTAKGYDVQLMQ